jgi:hypothetical protein
MIHAVRVLESPLAWARGPRPVGERRSQLKQLIAMIVVLLAPGVTLVEVLASADSPRGVENGRWKRDAR